MKNINIILLLCSIFVFLFEKPQFDIEKKYLIKENFLGPIISAFVRPFTKSATKSIDNVIEIQPAPLLRNTDKYSKEIFDIDDYLNRNFSSDGEINYMVDFNYNFNTLISDQDLNQFYKSLYSDWDTAYKNKTVSKIFNNDGSELQNSISDNLKVLAKKEFLLLYVIFSYSEEADSAIRQDIHLKKLRSKDSEFFKKEIFKKINCLQLSNLISMRVGVEIDYQESFKKLIESQKCPRLKPTFSEIKLELKKIKN